VSLLQAAEARGYYRFVIHRLSDNLAVRPLLNRIGSIISSTTHGGVSEITFVRR